MSREGLPTETATGDWTLTHDYFYSVGGAERVTAVAARDVLPGAPIRVIDYALAATRELGIPDHRLGVLSPVGAWLSSPRTYRHASLVVAALLRTVLIPGNVLASSYAFAHYVQATGQKVVYCHSPLRQIWLDGATPQPRLLPRTVHAVTMGWAQRRDTAFSREATAYVSSGPIVTERLRAFYGVEPAAEIFPPIDTEVFAPVRDRDDYFVFSGRIVEPYKRLEPLIEAFRLLPFRLLVAGDGRHRPALESRAPKNVTFLGALPTAELAQVLARSRGLIFPSEDDFGMSPLEAIACGVPALALARGGALHSITEGLNGLFFTSHDPHRLAADIRRLARHPWDPEAIRKSVERFSRPRFVESLRGVLASVAD